MEEEHDNGVEYSIFMESPVIRMSSERSKQESAKKMEHGEQQNHCLLVSARPKLGYRVCADLQKRHDGGAGRI
jgi:hypothetical protein